MKDIQNLTVTQIRILPEDTIPYQILGLHERLKQIKDNYYFSGEEIPFPLHIPGTPKIVTFRMGELKYKDKSVIINQLSFEGRRIVLVVIGTSEDANVVFTDVAKFINRLTDKEILDESKCLVKTEDTQCSVALNIDYWSIFSDKTKQFIDNNLYLMFDQPIVAIEPQKLSFKIIFKQDSDLYDKENIAYSPKLFTVEPRENIPFEKGVYYTYSPFSSEIHLQLIRTFEDTFSKSGIPALPTRITPGDMVRKIKIKKRETT